MKLLSYKNKKPSIDESVFIAHGAMISGEVHIQSNSNIWYNTVIRGDVAPVYIGSDTNIQDGSVIHTSRFNGPCKIGDRVTIGHISLLHACDLHNDAFIGMGSIIMDNVTVESFGFVAAGSLVTPKKTIKSRELWAGRPAKFIRHITDEELFLIKDTPSHYIMLSKEHQKNQVSP